MAIKTRATTATGVENKGAPLTNTEVDNNFVELKQNKLEKSGDTITGGIRADTPTDYSPIYVAGENSDVNLLRVSGGVTSGDLTQYLDGKYGYTVKYMGSRSTMDNSLSFFTDNGAAATQIEAIRIQNDGETRFSQAPTVGGVAVSLSNHGHPLSAITGSQYIGALFTDVNSDQTNGWIVDTSQTSPADGHTWNLGKIQDERLVGVTVTVQHTDLETHVKCAIGTSTTSGEYTESAVFGGPDNMRGQTVYFFPVSALTENANNYLYIWGNPSDGGAVFSVSVHGVANMGAADQFYNSLTVPTFKGDSRAQGVWNFEDGIKVGTNEAVDGGIAKITFYEGTDPANGDSFRLYYDGENEGNQDNYVSIWSNPGNTGWIGDIAKFYADGRTTFNGVTTFNEDVVIQSEGSVGLTINADTDNAVSEQDLPFVKLTQDGGLGNLTVGIQNNEPYIYPFRSDVSSQSAAQNQLHIKQRDGSLGKIWHSANDGSGSGLDADTLDGIEADGFCRGANPTTELTDIDSLTLKTGFYDVATGATGNPADGLSSILMNIPGGAVDCIAQMTIRANNLNTEGIHVRHYNGVDTAWTDWQEMLHTGNVAIDLSSAEFKIDDSAIFGGSITAAGNLNLSGGNFHIAMQENQYIRRRFEMLENFSPQYILLCQNLENNDVNGTIEMDRTSGNWQAAKVEVIVTGAGDVGTGIKAATLRTLQATQNNEAYRLVTLTYNSNSWVAIEYTGNTYPATTGVYFTGRIKSTLAGELTVVSSASVSNVASEQTSLGKSDFYGVQTVTGNFNCNSNITAVGSVSGATLVATSDARVKENVETITGAMDKVSAMRGVTFNKLDDPRREVGVIAQEVEKVLPEAVYDGEVKSVAYGNMVGLLIEALKEQQAEIDELRAMITGGAQ